MMTTLRFLTLFATLAAFSALPAHADTLELKSGSLLQGTYLGGTQTTVRFQVGGAPQTLAVADIVALTFDSSAGAQPVQEPVTPTPIESPANAPAGTPAANPQAAQPPAVVVPAGATLLVRMREGVDSKRDKTGHRFTAVLEAPLSVGSNIVAPIGSLVYGRLASADSAGRVAGKAELSLELTDIMVNGQRQPVLTGSSTVKGSSQAQNSAGKVVKGAVIGGLIKGKKGAKTGAKVGVGAAVLTGGNQVSVPAGTLLEFSLRSPMHIQ